MSKEVERDSYGARVPRHSYRSPVERERRAIWGFFPGASEGTDAQWYNRNVEQAERNKIRAETWELARKIGANVR